ncbi:MAG: hypothetical protein NVV82_20405 [Sporocytophaga sp.]|nr:hypothetical protein [Sporocytophaga sp.]
MHPKIKIILTTINDNYPFAVAEEKLLEATNLSNVEFEIIIEDLLKEGLIILTPPEDIRDAKLEPIGFHYDPYTDTKSLNLGSNYRYKKEYKLTSLGQEKLEKAS